MFVLIRDGKIVGKTETLPPIDEVTGEYIPPDWFEIPDDDPLLTQLPMLVPPVVIDMAAFREQVYTSDTYTTITANSVATLAVTRLENLMFGGSSRIDLMVQHWNDVINGLPGSVKNQVVTQQNVAKFNTAATFYKLPFRFDSNFLAFLVDP